MSDPAVTTSELTHLEFRASIPCGHIHHNQVINGMGHQGEHAIWAYDYRCPCGCVARAFVCNGFKVMVRANAIICSTCGTRHVGGIGVATFDPIVETAP